MILIGKTVNCLLGAYVIAHSAVLKAVYEFVHMREITRSVKVGLKRLIAVILVDDDFPYWTSKVEHLVAFTAIFSNICTEHAQKRLFMNFRCKFRHRSLIRRPRFHIRVQNFSDLATFSVDFCILYAECPPYFYFRFVWPTELESIPHAWRVDPDVDNSHQVEVDMTIHCQVIAFLSADTSRDLVTLTFDLLTLNSCCAWRVTWPNLLPSLKTLSLSVIDLWVITFPVGYHWECVRGKCACAESRDPWVGGQKQLHFWNPRSWFAYSLCTLGGSRMNVIKVICENNARPCVKRRMSFCACAKSRDLLKVS